MGYDGFDSCWTGNIYSSHHLYLVWFGEVNIVHCIAAVMIIFLHVRLCFFFWQLTGGKRPNASSSRCKADYKFSIGRWWLPPTGAYANSSSPYIYIYSLLENQKEIKDQTKLSLSYIRDRKLLESSWKTVCYTMQHTGTFTHCGHLQSTANVFHWLNPLQNSSLNHQLVIKQITRDRFYFFFPLWYTVHECKN